MQTVFYGRAKIALYIAGILLGTMDLTDDIATPDQDAFASAWIDGKTLDSIREEFPGVNFRDHK